MKKIEIFPCGTTVTLPNGIFGKITAVFMRFSNVTYEVGYFIEGDYKFCTLSECEFTANTAPKIKIGFK